MTATVNQQHAFNHAPAALRIFRFAADSAPRVLEIMDVSKFLRECAVEFGSADAALPGAMRSEYAAKRYFKLRAVVERNAARCPWLAEKIMVCRSGAPIPAAALAPDVTRHDVNWGAEGARMSDELQLTHGGCGLTFAGLRMDASGNKWAQGPIGVTSGKHFFQVCFSQPQDGCIMLGWVDDKISAPDGDFVSMLHATISRCPGMRGTLSAGAIYLTRGSFWFGTAPLAANSRIEAPENARPCVLGCLLDMAATPARMTVFVDGEPLAVQCEYDFPKDGRTWYPSVALRDDSTAMHSCAI
jgi:hypothetical protein